MSFGQMEREGQAKRKREDEEARLHRHGILFCIYGQIKMSYVAFSGLFIIEELASGVQRLPFHFFPLALADIGMDGKKEAF